MFNSDNVIFNVNGQSLEKLTATIELAIGKKGTVAGWLFIKEKGFVLVSYIGSSDSEKVTKFPVPLTAERVAPIIFEWLKTAEAKTVPMKGWDADADHDGSNELGWRVYTEDWGHINGMWNCLAIKPAYMWYGK